MSATIQELAGKMYAAYSARVGGKNFQGDPLPDWKEFSTDPKKTVQANGWIEVARVAVFAFEGTPPRRSFREDLILVFAEKLRTPQDIMPERLRGCVIFADEIIGAMNEQPKS
jgi:hypothetical protein